jgi:hypothetical protein
MIRTLVNAGACVLVLATAVAQGIWTERWTVSHDLETAVARLKGIPMAFGDWKGRPVSLDERQLQVAEVAGYMARNFENQRDGERVTVLLVCGRAGPIAIHTPDVCYDGAGYTHDGVPAKREIPIGPGGVRAEFDTAEFRKDGPIPRVLDIDWSWYAGGVWSAPTNPRLQFGHMRALYKLYVIHEASPSDKPRREAIPLVFLREFLPVLDGLLKAQSQTTP